MLMDMIGVLLGFVAIMLLLSMITMILNQVTHDIFRLRARNLWSGISALLGFSCWTDPQKASMNILYRKMNRRLEGSPRTKIGKMLDTFLGPVITEISYDEFVNLVKEESGGKKGVSKEEFKRMEELLIRRFKKVMNWVSFGWSVVIAVCFQISTPELLYELSTNDEFREEAVELADQAKDTYDTVDKVPNCEILANKALNKLARRHPDLEEILEEVSGQGESPQNVINEIKLVLADHDINTNAVISDYNKIFEELLKNKRESLMSSAATVSGDLAKLDIRPWKAGIGFYFTAKGFPRLDHWLGVFITALLLSLGAPFWFERIKDLASIKDAFSSQRKQKTTEKENGDGKEIRITNKIELPKQKSPE